MSDSVAILIKHLCCVFLIVLSICNTTSAQSNDEALVAQVLERFRVVMVLQILRLMTWSMFTPAAQ